MAEKQGLSVAEAQRISGIGMNEFYRRLNAGEIPHIRVGRRFVIPRASLEAYLVATAEADAAAQKATV